MEYAKDKKSLDTIRTKYNCAGDIIFRTAIQNVFDCGRQTFQDDEWFKEQMDEIKHKHDEADANGKILFVSRDFEELIMNCAKEISAVEIYSILIYVQQEVWLGDGIIGKPDYNRALQLIKNCIYEFEDDSCTYEELHEKLYNCDFTDDELEYLGCKIEIEEDSN